MLDIRKLNNFFAFMCIDERSIQRQITFLPDDRDFLPNDGNSSSRRITRLLLRIEMFMDEKGLRLLIKMKQHLILLLLWLLFFVQIELVLLQLFLLLFLLLLLLILMRGRKQLNGSTDHERLALAKQLVLERINDKVLLTKDACERRL